MRLALFSAALILSATAHADRWNGANSPAGISRITGKPVNYRLSALPLRAELSNPHYIWSDTFWPAKLGGIAYRWNNEPNPEPFKYRLLSKMEVKAASVSDLERLSPSEKYDIYMGNYNYPLTKKVLSMNSPRDLWWEGICHGWAQAAVMHIEPARNDLRNPDGVLVPFGSSDVKGLIDFYYAKVHQTNKRFQVGKRCKAVGKVPGEGDRRDRVTAEPSASARNSADCSDVNAGAFHVVMANMIGLNDKGLVVEIDRYNDVWNQPVGKYDAEIISRNGNKVHVRMNMTYGEELNLLTPEEANDVGGFMSMFHVTGTPANTTRNRIYDYILELDNMGNIVGGEWISNSRPDFLWSKMGTDRFSNEKYGLGGLNEIYRPVID